MPDGIEITLGERKHTVVPQGIGRIRRKLVALMQLGDGGSEFDGEIDAQLYDLLVTFIPDLAPLSDLLGEQEDEAARRATEPNLPQLLDAIETIYRVNGADRLVRLGKSVFGAEGLQTLLHREALTLSLDRSLSSQSPSGDSAPTSSTPTPPTSIESEDRPSLDSSPSSTPESVAA